MVVSMASLSDLIKTIAEEAVRTSNETTAVGFPEYP